MLRFASALPALRDGAMQDLRRRGLKRDRVLAGVVRLIDLGLFRIGGERYAELDHHYGVTTLEKRHVRVTRNGILFDYVAKWGKERTICVTDRAVLPTVRALAGIDNGHEALFCYEHDGGWHQLHSREVGSYIASRAGGHFTAKEFRTWNATVLMALVLANAGPSATPASRKRVIAASDRATRTANSGLGLVTVTVMIAELPSELTVTSCRATDCAFPSALTACIAACTTAGLAATAVTRLSRAAASVSACGAADCAWIVAVAAYLTGSVRRTAATAVTGRSSRATRSQRCRQKMRRIEPSS